LGVRFEVLGARRTQNLEPKTSNPMPKSILLTSFDVWKARHKSNASDDLIEELLSRNLLGDDVHLLRKLPVDFELAPEKIIATLQTIQPHLVILCGMAERRSRLSVESNGRFEDDIIHTTVDIQDLVRNLPFTRVSHNAGKFVCNRTYYSVLKYLNESKSNLSCIFVHVPVLTEANREAIVADFSSILARLRSPCGRMEAC